MTCAPLTDNATCFRVTTTPYVAGLLGVVSSVTGGALSVVPKQKDCSTVITNMQNQIVMTGSGSAAAQLKGWQALLKYAQPKDGNGTPTLAPIYMAPQGRVTTP